MPATFILALDGLTYTFSPLQGGERVRVRFFHADSDRSNFNRNRGYAATVPEARALWRRLIGDGYERIQ